ncbi:Ku protein [Prescottella subtropica]|uniref:non-homologous end joining protein Ku n=1 Tax=Prescottella subtropica TaxID=2545757 RepID=UPI0010F72C12|nr:Ku protein [Prescottella subtropica]
MRSLWTGSIAFGLVDVPVKVYSATEDHDIHFHQVHARDGGRIRYERACSVCGEIVQYTDIDRAYDSDEGDRVILTDDDFEHLPAAGKHEIPVLQFVPSDQIDPILLEKSYYLEPDSASPKAYALLAKTLATTDRTALVHFTLRQKTRLAALRERGGILVLQTLLWPDEVRAAEFPIPDGVPAPKSRELRMAGMLVDAMADDFDPTAFTDDYQVELRHLLDDTISHGGEKVVPAAERARAAEDAEVVDLVAALQRSLDEAAAHAHPASVPAKKRSARRRRA